jgi:hypothetical protein
MRLARWALAAVSVGSAALVLVGLPINFEAQTDASSVELASLAAASLVLRSALLSVRLLQFALLGQAADMLTFVLAWQRGAAERNPIAQLFIDWALGTFPGTGTFPFAVAGLALILAKLGLILYLVRITPFLGRYRNVVLTVALLVGLVGTISNVVAFSPA